jgi:tetratricopeptide (TPR) repeat protein
MKVAPQKHYGVQFVLAVLVCWNVGAQDKVHTQQGAVHDGRVMKVDADGVWIDLGGAQSKIRRADIVRVEIPLPAEAREAFELHHNGKFSAAIPKLEAILARYEGLPQDWIEQVGYQLADCHLQTGNSSKALQLFERTEKFFPDSPRVATSVAGRARAAFGLKDYEGAIKLLEPMVAEKEKVLGLTDADKNDLASAYLTLGECQLAQGLKPKALESFLKVTALYYVNAAAVSESLYWSGVIFEETNNLPRAAGQYKDFLKSTAGSPRSEDARSRLQKVEARLPKDQSKAS